MTPDMKKVITVLEALDRGMELVLPFHGDARLKVMMDDEKNMFFEMHSYDIETGETEPRWLGFTPPWRGFFTMCMRLTDSEIRIIQADLVLNDPKIAS